MNIPFCTGLIIIWLSGRIDLAIEIPVAHHKCIEVADKIKLANVWSPPIKHCLKPIHF